MVSRSALFPPAAAQVFQSSIPFGVSSRGSSGFVSIPFFFHCWGRVVSAGQWRRSQCGKAYYCSGRRCRRVRGWELEHTGEAAARLSFRRSNTVAPPPLPSTQEKELGASRRPVAAQEGEGRAGGYLGEVYRQNTYCNINPRKLQNGKSTYEKHFSLAKNNESTRAS